MCLWFFVRNSMGRNRKGHGALRGAVPKKRKLVKKNEQPEEEKPPLFALKMVAKTAIRPHVHDRVIPWFEKMSLKMTKMCELASLLFLTKVREMDDEATETGDWSFF